MKPITPDEVGPAKGAALPPEVIEVWNRLIATNAVGGTARITQNEAVEALQHRMFCKRQHVFDSHWCDMEDLYRSAGWDVKYDKPGYDAAYDAYFLFSRRR